MRMEVFLEIIITDGGFGYVKEPEVYITGGDGNAVATVELDLNNSSATYGQVVGINVTNGGLGYDREYNICFHPQRVPAYQAWR